MYGTHTLEIINRLLEKDDMGCQRGNQFEEVLSSEKEVFTRILLKFFSSQWQKQRKIQAHKALVGLHEILKSAWIFHGSLRVSTVSSFGSGHWD